MAQVGGVTVGVEVMVVQVGAMAARWEVVLDTGGVAVVGVATAEEGEEGAMVEATEVDTAVVVMGGEEDTEVAMATVDLTATTDTEGSFAGQTFWTVSMNMHSLSPVYISMDFLGLSYLS